MYSENHGLNSINPALDLKKLKSQSPFTVNTVLIVSPEGFFASRSLKLVFFRMRFALSLSERAPNPAIKPSLST